MAMKIKKLIQRVKPNYIVFEDVQFQRNKGVFKTLSQMQGALIMVCFELDIGFTIIEPSAWKSYCAIKGKNREEQKPNTQKFVKIKFKKDCNEDEADSIAIGWWSVNNIKEDK